jgi:hypothetical protein
LYDTVGLELDNSITQRTLKEIRVYIEKAQNGNVDRDINLVWFCVNSKSSRFEPYEVELIKGLANSYEIPFVIVVTQCFSGEMGDLEKQIKSDLPEVSIMRLLAKDYETRIGVIPAFGIAELLCYSVFDYDKLKTNILESKLERLSHRREEKIAEIKDRANRCIQEYAQSARKIGKFPLFCIPFIHGICIKMLYKLDKIIGIHTTKGFEEYIFTNVIVGIIVTPLMVIPLCSAAAAQAYIEKAGEEYLKALIAVIEKSTDSELANIELVSARIKDELSRKKKK